MAAPSSSVTPRIGDPTLAARLSRELEGEVLFDAFSRGRYATDASMYQMMPLGVIVPMVATVEEAEQALEEFAQAWDEKYPTIAKMWRAKWADIITLFDFPWPIRKAIYTTNAIESVNSVIRKFTRNRKIYPNQESALKLVYMAIHEASKKWKMPIRHWKQALNHFAIMFEGRMPELTSK